MKRILPLVATALLGLLVYSCDSEGRLAKEIAGTWVSTPENFTDNNATTASIIDTYIFMPDSTSGSPTHAGPLMISGMISTSTQVIGDGSEPVNVSTAARSTISGSWTVVDDDEVLLRLDPATLSITVDPADVAVSMNPLSPDDIQVDSLRSSMSTIVSSGLRQALLTRYASLSHLDDVKVNGQLLKFEINDFDHILTKQQ